MNLIKYYGANDFRLLQNVPEEKPTHYLELMSEETRKVYKEEYANAIDVSDKNSINIMNPHDIPSLVWIDEVYGWCDVKNNKFLKPGDTFPLPATTNEDCKNGPDQCDVRNRTFIRLYASKEEESQEELWDLVYNNYVTWLNQEFRTKELLKDFTIQRKKQ